MLLCTVSFFSCSDDDNESTNTQVSDIVGIWRTTKIEERTAANPWENVTEACDLDDTEEYSANGDWALYPGTVTCGSAAVMTGTWELRANNTKVVYTYDGASGEYESTVESLGSDTMVLTHSAGDLANTQYRTTYIKD